MTNAKYCQNRLALNRIIPTIIAMALVCFVQTANGESQTSNPPQLSKLTGAQTVADLIKQIGREPDTSEQGGACGGILVHDWVSENIRVISLGGAVQALSVLPESAHSEVETANPPVRNKDK